MTSPPDEEKTEKAKQAVLQLYQGGLQVAYSRELRYRLETLFPHDVIGNAVKVLEKSKKLKRTNVPGKRGAGREHPNVFFRLPKAQYKKLLPVMRKKLDLSIFISGVSRNMGRHALPIHLWHIRFLRMAWKRTRCSYQGMLGKQID